MSLCLDTLVSRYLCRLPKQHESLSIGDDLGSVERSAKVLEELLLVAGELGRGARKALACLHALLCHHRKILPSLNVHGRPIPDRF